MTESQLKPGDVVQLKSGGPSMTIETLKPVNDLSSNMIVCTWFQNSELKRETFAKAALKIHEAQSIF